MSERGYVPPANSVDERERASRSSFGGCSQANEGGLVDASSFEYSIGWPTGVVLNADRAQESSDGKKWDVQCG